MKCNTKKVNVNRSDINTTEDKTLNAIISMDL
jgi:hypothetical protein